MRARNIKPSFFKNPDLGECSPVSRLLFAGLWCVADREGRLLDRPKLLKAEVFPYDSIEVEPLLQELEAAGLIKRYEVDGIKIIWVITFCKHQAPHVKEKDSELPAFNEKHLPRSVPAPTQVVVSTNLGSGQHPLNPDCGILNPDCGMRNKEPSATAVHLPCFSDFLNLWNFSLGQSCRETPKRKREFKVRIRDPVWAASFSDAICRCGSSSFCLGINDRGWTADPDWFLRPDTVTKILEGKYDNRAVQKTPQQANGAARKPTDVAAIIAERKRMEAGVTK